MDILLQTGRFRNLEANFRRPRNMALFMWHEKPLKNLKLSGPKHTLDLFKCFILFHFAWWAGAKYEELLCVWYV